jgi:hypothetical protein
VNYKLIIDALLDRVAALEIAVNGRPPHRVSKPELAKEESCSTRTVDRRVEQKLLPPPDDVINGRLFWWSDTLERHRRERARAEVNTKRAKAARDPRLRAPSNRRSTSPAVGGAREC